MVHYHDYRSLPQLAFLSQVDAVYIITPCFSYNQFKYYPLACSLVSQVASLLWVFQNILFALLFSFMCAYLIFLSYIILFSIW